MTDSILDLIRAARPAERKVPLFLRGDLVARHADLERELVAVATGDDSFGGSGDSVRLASQVAELETEMRASVASFCLRSIGPFASNDLIAAHPPRDGEKRDEGLGYNPETFYPARIRATCYAIDRGDERLALLDDEGVDLEAMTDADWSQLMKALAHSQFDQLFEAAWNLDHGDLLVPTSRLASLISLRNGEHSKQHSAGASLSDASTDASPESDMSTSTPTAT